MVMVMLDAKTVFDGTPFQVSDVLSKLPTALTF
jgi:hypothetical protein